MIYFFVYFILKILIVFLPVLITVAFFTVFERKALGAIQRRKGPNVVGFFGLLQAFSDGLKLFLKESILPSSANTFLFFFAPILTFFLGLASWAVIPFGYSSVISDINLGLLYLLSMSSLGVYGIMISGWSSNSKYAFLGALRSTAQIVSYEVSIGFILVSVVLCASSLNLTEIVISQKYVWYCFPLIPMCLLFFISALAETNRHPFDLPEAEAELVSGYNVEYSGISFALFFLGEYSNIILISSLIVLLFFGGWLFPGMHSGNSFFFGLKILVFLCLFVWARAAYPRYRYDQLMHLGWKVFLPLSLSWVLSLGGLLTSFNLFLISIFFVINVYICRSFLSFDSIYAFVFGRSFWYFDK